MRSTSLSPAGHLYRGLSYAIFLIFAVLTAYPLFWLFSSSLKTNRNILTAPLTLPPLSQLQFTNYSEAWILAEMGLNFLNSLLYTFVTLFLVLFLGSMIAYVFAKGGYQRLSKVLYALFGLGILITIHSLIIPLFLLLSSLNLEGTRPGIILTYTAMGLPLAVFVITEYMKGLPDSLIESAYMDGAGSYKTFLSIVLPLTVPVQVTIGIMTIIATWNEFLLGFILSSSRTRPLPAAVFAFANSKTPQYHLQFASMVIAILPVLLLYILSNKKITEGVIAGSIKG